MMRDTLSWTECLPLRGKWLSRLVVAIILLPQLALIVLTLFGPDLPWGPVGRWIVWDVMPH